MAGLPRPVIDRANQILDSYMKKSFEKEIETKNERQQKKDDNSKKMLKLINVLDQVDINNTTPYQALEILSNLKKRNDF